VRALADRLRADGVEAWIDQYIQDPNEGWIRWMRQKVKQADKVLLTFTETYQRRFEGDEEGKGLGATFEGVIVTQALYESGGRNAKFRPVSAASWGQALCSSHNSTNSASRRRRSFSALASIFVLTRPSARSWRAAASFALASPDIAARARISSPSPGELRPLPRTQLLTIAPGSSRLGNDSEQPG